MAALNILTLKNSISSNRCFFITFFISNPQKFTKDSHGRFIYSLIYYIMYPSHYVFVKKHNIYQIIFMFQSLISILLSSVGFAR